MADNMPTNANYMPTDIISRQAAIDAVEKAKPAVAADWQIYVAKTSVLMNINSLPSVPPMQWIPCSERLPEDLDEVIGTWVNHDPEPYYDFVKDKPLTAPVVFYKGKWYWWTPTAQDLLAEYGERCKVGLLDEAIEIVAWMPLPEPYAERRDS